MKTILIPVDFSVSSNNAINYAADLSNHRHVDRIILFAQCYVSLFEQIIPTPDFIQTGEEEARELRGQLKGKLEELKTQLLKKLNSGTIVTAVFLKMPLLRATLKLIEEEKPDVLLFGSNNDFVDEKSSVGEHMIELARVSPVPVFIIPPDTRYVPITHALVACDFKTLNHVGLLKRLQRIKHWPRPKLALLNVDPFNKHLDPLHPAQEINGILKEMLVDYEYELFYSDESDILKGVIEFADQHQQQLIIALPGEHSFLYSLTHQSITEGLSRDAGKPVLILK